MGTRFFALTAALIFAFAQVPASYARGTDAAADSDWSSVQARVGGSILGAGAGAAVGAALGLGTNYETIYEAR